MKKISRFFFCLISIFISTMGNCSYSFDSFINACNKYLSVSHYAKDNNLEVFKITDQYDYFSAGVCVGYLGGMINQHNIYNDIFDSSIYCIPDNLDIKDIIHIVLGNEKMIKKDSKEREDAGVCINYILLEKYPCSRKPEKTDDEKLPKEHKRKN